MRKAYFTLLCIFLTLNTIAQSAPDFTGKWKVQQEGEFADHWVLKKPKEEVTQRDWGKFLEFNADGTYSEYASAPCGLDDNHYRYAGKWIYHNDSKTLDFFDIKVLNDRPNIYMDYKVLSSGSIKVLSFKKGEWQMQVIKNWEEVSKNKE